MIRGVHCQQALDPDRLLADRFLPACYQEVLPNWVSRREKQLAPFKVARVAHPKNSSRGFAADKLRLLADRFLADRFTADRFLPASMLYMTRSSAAARPQKQS
jgi:hypothetical protein